MAVINNLFSAHRRFEWAFSRCGATFGPFKSAKPQRRVWIKRKILPKHSFLAEQRKENMRNCSRFSLRFFFWGELVFLLISTLFFHSFSRFRPPLLPPCCCRKKNFFRILRGFTRRRILECFCGPQLLQQHGEENRKTENLFDSSSQDTPERESETSLDVQCDKLEFFERVFGVFLVGLPLEEAKKKEKKFICCERVEFTQFQSFSLALKHIWEIWKRAQFRKFPTS